ncbi:hypothetical protein NL676_011904 [Syzygium grande]|nr:hypothetical protein NL676_011904 [Syzygium grande]
MSILNSNYRSLRSALSHDSKIGELAATVKLEQREAPTSGRLGSAPRPQADRLPVALECEHHDGVKSPEDEREGREQLDLGIKRQTMPVLLVDVEPPSAHDRALLPVTHAEEVENVGQAVVGQVAGVVIVAAAVLFFLKRGNEL